MSYLQISAGVATAGILGLAHYFSYSPSKVPLDGAHVLITGGSSGIGLATAKLCLQEGASHVVILGSNPKKLEAALETLKPVCKSPKQKVTGIAKDVSAPSVVDTILEHVSNHGAVDILIASAGVTHVGFFEDTDMATFERLMRINYLGAVGCTKGVIPGMKAAKKGRIVFVSSMAGLTGMVGYSSYSASKFALKGLGESLNMELCPWGIGVSIVNPPNVDTPMYEEEMKSKPKPTKLCDEGSGLFTAEAIAKDIIGGIKSYKFFIQSGFDGVMLGLSTIGMGPAHSALQLLTEVVTQPILRFVAAGYQKMFYDICRKCAKEDQAK